MKRIVILFLIWRIGLFAISAMGPKILPVHGNTFPYIYILEEESRLPRWLNSFGGFDGVYYLRIAKDGYEHKFTQAFFPLYPILIKIFSYVVGNNLLTSALIISNSLFLFSLFIFYRLLKRNYSENVAIWASTYLIFFPTSFYFGSVYTESLFFLLILLGFLFYEKEKFFLASIFGFFSSFTRLVGVFLVPAMFKPRKIESLYLLVIPLGLFIYMFYLYFEFKNPFYFLTSQSIFGQARSTSEIILLPQVFYRYLKIFLSVKGMPLANAVFEFSSTIFALIFLTLAYYKKIKKEWIIFSMFSIILPTLTGTLASMPRYILIAFPIYIYLGMIKNTTIKYLVLILFLIMLVPCVILFTRGYWVA